MAEIGEYFKYQGIEKFYDVNYLISKYPNAKESLNAYGARDEFIYKEILSTLSNTTNPTLIITLTTSNHPPFSIPKEFSIIPSPYILESFNITNLETTYLDIAAYRYANNAFGDFLDKLKDSKLKDKVIVFATGDHKFRVLKSLNLDSIVGDYGVPLYIYLPLAYQKQLAKNNIKINFNIARVGSHKDIFPTLFELTLSNAKYISLGGRNILSPSLDSKYEFGIHSNIWIDKSGAYQNNLLFQWAKNGDFKNIKDLIQTQEVVVEIDVNLKSEFKDDYNKLNRMQLNYMLKSET